MSKEKWLEDLAIGKAFCYIKPTTKKHDSGYRMFEVGYLTEGDDLKAKEKLVLGYSDCLWITDYELLTGKVSSPEYTSISFDILLDGHIRIWGYDNVVYWWESMERVGPTAMLKKIK